MIIWYQKQVELHRDGPHLGAPCQERPFNLFMGGGRFKSKAPMLSWYRNPQFRVSMRQPQAPLESEDGINQNAKKYGQSLFINHGYGFIIIHYHYSINYG
jgi:hypothetical protein